MSKILKITEKLILYRIQTVYKNIVVKPKSGSMGASKLHYSLKCTLLVPISQMLFTDFLFFW